MPVPPETPETPAPLKGMTMQNIRIRPVWFTRIGLSAVFALATLAVQPTSASAQTFVKTADGYRIFPKVDAADKSDIWNLHFEFKEPRTMTVDVPGRGRKLIWYMWYQVYNDPAKEGSKEPVTIVPEFELVTGNGTRHFDEVMPAVQDQIRKFEDPTGRMDLKNSVTISLKPIQPTPEKSAPKTVTGVAIWTDVHEKASDTATFQVFITGLSNGWARDQDGMIRRKTLELRFRKVGDGKRVEANDLRFTEDLKWIYRAADVDFKGSLPSPSPKLFDEPLAPFPAGPGSPMKKEKAGPNQPS